MIKAAIGSDIMIPEVKAPVITSRIKNQAMLITVFNGLFMFENSLMKKQLIILW